MDERSKRRLIRDHLVWQRYGVSPMTGWRWDHDPTLNFPKPYRIRKRKYRAEDELDEFDQRRRSADEPVEANRGPSADEPVEANRGPPA